MMKTEVVNQQIAKIKLPAKWRWTQLDEVCEPHIDCRDPQAKPDKEFHYIDISSIDNNRKRIIAPKIILGRDAPSRARQIVRAGDVIVSTTRPNLNAVALVGQDMDNQVCSTGFCVLRAKSSVLPDYLFMFVQTPEFVNSLSNSVKGALYPAVTDKQVRSQIIPLAPLSEQQRITRIISKQMIAVEQASAAAEMQLEAAKALPAAYLRNIFESDEAQQWPKKHIGEMARVQSGYAFKSEWFNLEGIRLLRNVNILQGFVNWNDKVYLPLSRRHEFKSYELARGDIVLSLDRPVVTSGLKIARLTPNDVPSLLLQRVARFLLLEGIDRDYLYAFLNSATFISSITKHAQSLGVPHISPKQIESVRFPLPPLIEQRRIATILDDQLAKVEQARNALEEQLASINALPAALLCNAFNGAL